MLHQGIETFVSMLVLDGVLEDFPQLKLASVELGAGWVPELFRRMKIAYGKMPQLFAQDPIQNFIDHVWVMPFAEDDVAELVKDLPIDNVIYGSDWPHPEGLADPIAFVDELTGLDDAGLRKLVRMCQVRGSRRLRWVEGGESGGVRQLAGRAAPPS